MEDEVWNRKAVAFWMVDPKADTIKPIGMAAVVSDALLTNKHVYHAIDVAIASQMKVYVSAVKKTVKSVLGMVQYQPRFEVGPSDKNCAAFPISSDFTMLPMPDQFSHLGVGLLFPK